MPSHLINRPTISSFNNSSTVGLAIAAIQNNSSSHLRMAKNYATQVTEALNTAAAFIGHEIYILLNDRWVKKKAPPKRGSSPQPSPSRGEMARTLNEVDCGFLRS